MTWRRHACGRAEAGSATDDFHHWVLSLPWVVERPYALGSPPVRTFAVDCELLDVRQLWLVTGLGNGRGVAVVVPAGLADELRIEGLVREIAPMPASHVLVGIPDDTSRVDVETVILEAYAAILP